MSTDREPQILSAQERVLWPQEEIFDYSKAADPIASGATPLTPNATFGPKRYTSGPSCVISLDLSSKLQHPSAATTPSLLASFVRIRTGEQSVTGAYGTSEMFYVIRGVGKTIIANGEIGWQQGDMFASQGVHARHLASEDSAFHMVEGSPLLTYPSTREHAPGLIRRSTQATLRHAQGKAGGAN